MQYSKQVSYRNKMKSFKNYSFILLLSQLISVVNAIGHSLHDFNRPYFCSTCFSNTQDQNYHCCFYFFKCCAEARRGSRSTTPSPRYPGVPSHMTFIVQNRNTRPCLLDCKEARLASNLCCRMQSPENTPSSNPVESSGAFKTAVNVQVIELDDADIVYQNATEQEKTSETEAGTTESEYKAGIEINDNPFNLELKNADSDSKLFIPPSLAVDHVIEGDFDQGEKWRKQGWFTKEILQHQEDEH